MKTNIRFPKISYGRRENFVIRRCEYLCDDKLQKAVTEGRFVLAWDGELNSDNQIPTLGVLESVTMNKDGGRTYTITSEHGSEHVPYQNANVLREDLCPEVVIFDKYGRHQIHRWIGLQEHDGKVCATLTHDGRDDFSVSYVDPTKLILLDDCKVGLPEREDV